VKDRYSKFITKKHWIMGMVASLLRVTSAELEAYLKDSSLLEERIYSEDSEEDPALVYIDKSWGGILFLLTGQNLASLDHPMGQVLFSGQVIDEEQDLGYGPGQYLTPGQVKELDVTLSKIPEEELTRRFDPGQMIKLEVYPGGWDGEGMWGYLLEYFKEVQAIYSTAAGNDEAIITYIS
jgi:Domain of unknown function (DUF1877)